MSIISLLLTITKKVKLSYGLTNFLEWIFGVISYIKIQTRSLPFAPWDLSITDKAFEIVAFTQITPRMFGCIIAELIIIIALTVIQVCLFEEYCEIPKKSKRGLLAILSIISLLFFSTKFNPIKMKYLVSECKGFESSRAMEEYGALSSFIIDFSVLNSTFYVEEYSENKIKDIFYQYQDFETEGEKKEYDNVILLLLESFVDFEEATGIYVENDLIDNYHKIAENNVDANIHVKVIGGGTANVEYETLTMYDTSLYVPGIIPYIHYVKKDVSSFANVFKENEYETTGIHYFLGDFYKRKDVYPLIGVDEFISLENVDEEKIEYYRGYIPDDELYKTTVNTIESEEKSFINAITIATHCPYGRKIQECEEYVEFNANEKVTYAVNDYMQALRKTDEMLGDLVNYIENSDEKTLLIVYGDHFPMMREMLGDMNLIDENDKNVVPSRYPELFTTPYMIVSNVDDAKINSLEDITPNMLGIYILENVKIDNLPWIYNVMYDYLKNGKNKEFYELIQYDDVHGERYWKGF